MIRRTAAKTPAPKAKTLAQQEVDFTAEGSPPPNKVGKRAPVVPTPAAVPANRGPARAAKHSDRHAAAARSHIKATR